jgi:hypothetical protein
MAKLKPIKKDLYELDCTYPIKEWNIYDKRTEKMYNYGRVNFTPIRFPKEMIGQKVKISIELANKETTKETETKTNKPKAENNQRQEKENTLHYRVI